MSNLKHSAPDSSSVASAFGQSVDQSNASPRAKWRRREPLPTVVRSPRSWGLFCDTLPTRFFQCQSLPGYKNILKYEIILKSYMNPLGTILYITFSLGPNGSLEDSLENLAQGNAWETSYSGSRLLSPGCSSITFIAATLEILWIPEFLKHVNNILFLTCFMPNPLSLSLLTECIQ